MIVNLLIVRLAWGCLTTDMVWLFCLTFQIGIRVLTQAEFENADLALSIALHREDFSPQWIVDEAWRSVMIRLRDNRVPVTQWAEQIEEFKRGYNGDIPASLQEFRPVTLRHAVADGIKQVAALAIKAANAAKTLDFRECYQAELWNKVKQMREAIQREIPDSVVVNVQQGASLAKVPLNLVFSYTTEEYIQRELDKIDIRVNVAAPHNAGPTERWVNNEDKRRKAGGDGGKDNSP